MDAKGYRILALNPSRTSTKVGVFQNEHLLFEQTLSHDGESLRKYKNVMGQCGLRKEAILHALDREGINLSKLDAVSACGGLVRPVEEGAYKINDVMLKDLQEGDAGQHISNLGGVLAHEIASGLNIPSFMVIPATLDELEPLARLSGLPAVKRKSTFHAFHQKAAAKKAAEAIDKPYKELNLIVVHMGEEVTVGVHKRGKVVDVSNGLDGEGPFSLSCTRDVPVGESVTLCYSGQYDCEDMLSSKGGLARYMGTINVQEVETLIAKGSHTARVAFEIMAYQIAKEIGAASTVVFGRVDAIVLTGTFVHAKSFVQLIRSRVDWIADVAVYPVENELQSLAEGTLRVLRGEERVKVYAENKESTILFH